MSVTVPTFETLQGELVDELGEDANDATVLARIGRWLNDTFDDILSRQTDWKWSRGVKQLSVVAPYNTGTVSVTKGSKTVTGSGTSWPAGWLHRIFWTTGSGANYRVASVDSATQLTLENEWAEDSAVDQTYYLVQEAYPLDNEAFEGGIMEIINPYASDPLEEVDLQYLIRTNPKLRTFGDPSAYALWGQESESATSDATAPLVYFDSYFSTTRVLTYFFHKQYGRLSGTQRFPIPLKFNRSILLLGARIRSGQFDGDQMDSLVAKYEGLIGVMTKENSKTGQRIRQFKETDIPSGGGGPKLPPTYPSREL